MGLRRGDRVSASVYEARNFVQYEPSLTVYHPDWGQGPYTLAAIKKARRYGMGMGRVLQTHEFPASVTLKYFSLVLFWAALISCCLATEESCLSLVNISRTVNAGGWSA